MCIAVAVSAMAWKPQFAGHRGGYKGVMNTAEAYRNGVDYYHYQGLECDVRVTKDGHYVILHDNTTGSVCPDADIDAQVSTLEELKALNFRQTRGGITYTGKICTVAEYLDICNEKGAFPIIELKWTTGINTNDMSNFKGLLDLVTEKGLREKAIFLTSMFKSIEHIRTNYPDVTCQYLLSSDSDGKYEFCVTNKVNPSFEAGALTPEIVGRYRRAGLEVAAWTVNSEANYKKYANMGVFMMTCDYLEPDKMPELDYPPIPEPATGPVEIEATVLWKRTAVDGNLPADFPSKAGATYTTGQQAAMADGTFYVNDYGTRTLLLFDRECAEPVALPYSDIALGGSAVHGITYDDADNMVIRAEATYGPTPSKVRLYKKGSTVPVEVEFTITKGGQNNFVFASGDLFSEEGGYLYFMPNSQNTVTAIHIAGGEYKSVKEHSGLSITGSTASVIIPIDNSGDNFIYQVRSNGFYRFNGSDKGSLVATAASTTAPARNSSLGGAYMVIGGHELLVHPSGTNYNGGFTIKDLSAENASLATFPEMGTAGYGVNAAVGTFMRPVKIKEDLYHLHCYTMGNGYGVYEIKAKGVDGMAEAAVPHLSLFPNPVVNTTVLRSSDAIGNVEIYSMSGACVFAQKFDTAMAKLDLSGLASGIYLLRTPSASMKLVKL